MFNQQQLYRALRPCRSLAFGAARLAPPACQQFVAGQLLNRLFAQALAEGELDFLNGRVVCIEVTDIPWRGPFSVQQSRLCLCPVGSPADVVIRGEFDSFLLLASAQVDPDTLFFRRRLVIEGDTDLGLGVKNLLDSVDQATLPGPLRQLLMYAGRFTVSDSNT